MTLFIFYLQDVQNRLFYVWKMIASGGQSRLECGILSSFFHFGVLSKVKQAFWRGNTSAKKAAQADFLVKMNLAPLMGRRDAAYDRAAELLNSDVFALGDGERRMLYAKILLLLDNAIVDTDAIIITLSSHDISIRERRMQHFLQTLHGLMEAAHNLILLPPESGREELGFFFGDSRSDSFVLDEDAFSRCEMNVIHSIAELVKRSAKSLKRYRGYAAKSFSQHNLERYNSAIREYEGFFRDLKVGNPTL